MTFNPNASLDPSQVEDVRGRSVGGRGLAVGGGAIGVVVTLLYVLLGGDPAVLTQQPAVDDVAPENSELVAECKTGADANAKQECRLVGYVNSIQSFWRDEYSRTGQQYTAAPTRLYSDAVQSGCGSASSAVGPFYCPTDTRIYIDLAFFDDLQTRFGARGGPFAEGYVIAHEYGHHIQNLTGALAQSGGQGAGSGAVRVELQADCLAGVWANNAASTGYLQPLTDAQIAEGIDAAAAVGDDRIQEKVQGQVNPETWTHGSSAQRVEWFTTGYKSGSTSDCDTFKGQP
jgi:predicted metalloprotease